MHVHLVKPAPSPFPERLLELLDEGIEVSTGPETHPETQVLVAGVPTREQLQASSQLRALVIPWAGLPRVTRELLAEFPAIAVFNLHHNAQPTAECALALMLAVAKSIVPVDRALRQGDWRPRYELDRSLLLQGKTALILGYGAIGSRLAAMCRGIGMQVLATRNDALTMRDAASAESLPEGVTLHPMVALSDLLPRADVLFLALPRTEATQGVIGRTQLAQLPPHAILINIGRGGLVEERALFEALRDRTIAGAGIDTWYQYPPDEAARPRTLPSELPFHELDNVVLSPHRAGHSAETNLLRAEHLAELLNTLQRGEEPAARVHPERGY
ncbi:MAG: 2-hydroxyacid dehydrogenase [Phycisphaerales bacterium JB037]